VLAAAAEAGVGASEATATEFEREDAYAPWRTAARKATRDVAYIAGAKEALAAIDEGCTDALGALHARRAEVLEAVEDALAAFDAWRADLLEAPKDHTGNLADRAGATHEALADRANAIHEGLTEA